MKPELTRQWIDKALLQPLHAKIHIPAVSKADSIKLLKSFKKELDILYKTDPENASTLLITTLYKESHFWIVIERIVGNALVGFLKNPDGTTERITLDYDPERDRRIELMKKYGFTDEEIREMEGL